MTLYLFHRLLHDINVLPWEVTSLVEGQAFLYLVAELVTKHTGRHLCKTPQCQSIRVASSSSFESLEIVLRDKVIIINPKVE